MTREIKFRGKSIDGQLVYGIPIKTHIGTYMVTEENPHICSVYGYMEIDEFVKVDENTIGQFTGLHDKNGKEIYEGDIVKTDVSRANATKNKTYRNFAIRYNAPHFWNGYDTLLMSEWRMEVIGNIYDNPELLKEE